MCPSKNFEAGESSRRYQDDEQVQKDHSDHDAVSVYESSLTGFRNLSLSGNNSSEGSTRPDQNQLNASSTAYKPLNGSWMSPSPSMPMTTPTPRNNYLQQTGNSRGMPMPYPNLPVSPFRMDQQALSGTGIQQYPSELCSRPKQHLYVNFYPVNSATVALLEDILKSPYGYMKSQETSRALSIMLSRKCSIYYIEEFVRSITACPEKLFDVACSYPGTNAIQTVIKLAKKRPVIELVPQVFAKATLPLMTNQYGLHAVTKCFVELEAAKYKPLFEKMMENDNWLAIAMDKNGCRVLNDCIDYLVDSFKNQLLCRIAACATELALDIYGNYVLQHVVDLGTSHNEKIVFDLLPHLENLCKVKNGSHLMEKCLLTPYCPVIVEKLIDTKKIVRFALHECANYVIQKAIETVEYRDSALYWKLISLLSKEKYTLLGNRHGKHVARWLPEHRVEQTNKYYQQL